MASVLGRVVTTLIVPLAVEVTVPFVAVTLTYEYPAAVPVRLNANTPAALVDPEVALGVTTVPPPTPATATTIVAALTGAPVLSMTVT
jgi:hypothetical protein